MLLRTFVIALCVSSFGEAALTRIEVQDRSVLLAGRTFGPSGTYERIRGKAFFAVDPKAAANREIVDLEKAPRNSAGLVEFSADLYVLRPQNPQLGNRTILYEAPNRGGKGML